MFLHMFCHSIRDAELRSVGYSGIKRGKKPTFNDAPHPTVMTDSHKRKHMENLLD